MAQSKSGTTAISVPLCRPVSAQPVVVDLMPLDAGELRAPVASRGDLEKSVRKRVMTSVLPPLRGAFA